MANIGYRYDDDEGYAVDPVREWHNTLGSALSVNESLFHTDFAASKAKRDSRNDAMAALYENLPIPTIVEQAAAQAVNKYVPSAPPAVTSTKYRGYWFMSGLLAGLALVDVVLLITHLLHKVG